MSAFRRKFYRLEAQLGELHQRIEDTVELDLRDRTGKISRPIERLATLGNLIGQLSIDSKDNGTLRSDKIVNVITKSRDGLRAAADLSPESDVFNCQLSNLSWLVSAKASMQTLAAALKVFSDNVIMFNEEIRYWEDVLELNWCVGLYALQTSPFRIWRRYMESGYSNSSDMTHKRAADGIAAEARPVPNTWLRFYKSVQRCIAPGLSSFRIGLFSSLSGSKLEIHRKKRKLRAMRDFNASAVGLLVEKCLSFEADIPTLDSSDSFNHGGLSGPVRTSVSLLKSILRNAGGGDGIHERGHTFIGIGDNVSCGSQYSAGIDILDPQDILQELIHILTDLLPRYKHVSAGVVVQFGRPSTAVRYWLPLSLALVSATTSLKIARDIGPVLIESISNFGATAFDFWSNWVVNPTRKLVRTIRHDEKSEIALMSKNSLEADRASLERMVVDFVLDRGGHSYTTSSADLIADKVREGDLTPVLRAYEKDLRSPFVGTLRGDLVRALLIQIQKTKVDVEVAMSGIDSLLKSQELVFGFVGLTPGLLISYASIRWFFGLLGNRRGFRLGRRQNDLRYSLRKIHRILLASSPTEAGRLTYRNHGLLICNVEILLSKAQTMLKGEDFRAFQEDSSDLVNENRPDKQLQIVERMAWTYAKWT
ncbi:ATP synthase regulation protein NCA2-domain-containing protein [Aspergillus varians]